MTFSPFLRGFILIILLFVFTYTTTAQNYYPADVGNEWVMESTDGKEKRTYTLETPEDPADQEYILLKIETEDSANNEVDIDRYFVTNDDEGIKLHKTVFTIALYAPIGDIIANFSPPVIFFGNVLNEGDKWKIIADARIATIELESITNLEVVGYEDVETPAGTFHSCAKVKLEVSTTGDIALAPTTSYQWLAPDVGPIKYENSNGIVYELVSYTLQTPTQEPEITEEPEMTEEELEITEEEEDQETVTEYDDMTYQQPPMTTQDPEDEDTQEEMDQTEMTQETEEDTQQETDETEMTTQDPEEEDTQQETDETEMTQETEEDTQEEMDQTEMTTQEPDEEGIQDEMDETEMTQGTQEGTDEMIDDTETTTPETEEETKNPYDVTGDGVVNILDLVRVASHFGEENAEVDVTGDGIVNILDLVAIAQNFSS